MTTQNDSDAKLTKYIYLVVQVQLLYLSFSIHGYFKH